MKYKGLIKRRLSSIISIAVIRLSVISQLQYQISAGIPSTSNKTLITSTSNKFEHKTLIIDFKIALHKTLLIDLVLDVETSTFERYLLVALDGQNALVLFLLFLFSIHLKLECLFLAAGTLRGTGGCQHPSNACFIIHQFFGAARNRDNMHPLCL
ncbi:unnamed protein product [Urochloa humidicola]